MRAVLLVVLAVLVSCGGGDPVAEVESERAAQARRAALDAGLGEDVAEFLALASRSGTGTYRVTYPGPVAGSELVVTTRGPDRRVDLVVDGETRETRLVVDGEAYECGPETSCERTDAFVPPAGVFTERAITDLRNSLVERAEDFTFRMETRPVAGVEARCLVTRLRSGHERPELAGAGTICLAPTGAVLLVDQGDERLEALEHSDDVEPSAFRPPEPLSG